MQIGQLFQGFQIIRQGIGLLIAIMLAQLAFGTETIGNYELWLWLLSLFPIFVLNGCLQALLSKSSTIKPILGAFVWLGVLAIIYGLIILGIPSFGSLLTRQQLEFSQYFGWGIIGHLLGLLIPYILLLQKEKKLLGLFALAYPTAALIIYGVNCLPNQNPIQIAKSFLWFSTFNAGVLLCILFRYLFRFGIDVIQGFKLIIRAWPLMLGSIVAMGSTLVDDYLVNAVFASSGLFAIWRYGAREVPLLSTFASAFSNRKLVEFDPNSDQHLANLKKETKNILRLILPFLILLLIFSPQLFQIAFGSAFKDSVPIFQMYVFLMFSRFVFPQVILLTNQNRRRILQVSIIELIINVGLSIWWVRHYGMIGIAAATVFAFYFEKILLAIFVFKDCQIKPDRYIPLPTFITFTLIGLIVLIWTQLNP